MHHLKRAQESQFHSQHPNDQLNSRAQKPQFLNVMPNPAIKTEPRDTSPLPYMFNNAYRLPDQTPSPQPVSPPYNHYTSNTPSPYHMGGTGTGNVNMISPNHHFNYGPVAPVAGLVNGAPIDFDVFQHQQQQQQQIPQHQHLQQQPHIGSLNQYYTFDSPSTQNQPPAVQQWQNTSASQFKQPVSNSINNNLINFNLNNPLTKTTMPSAAPASSQINTSNNGQNWNIPASMPIANNNINIGQMLANSQYNQHHQQQPALQSHNTVAGTGIGIGPADVDATSISTTSNADGPSVMSLFNMDSAQLMDLNSEELSNLSLSDKSEK